MLTLVICCSFQRSFYHIGRERLFIIRQGPPKNREVIMAISTRLYLFYLFDKNYSQNRKQEMESKILGERLKQTRRRLGLTQKDLSTATQLSQTSISRLENGDEVYASVLLSVLCYYQEKVSLDYILSQDFDATSNRLFQRSTEEARHILSNQVQRIINSLKLSSQAYIQQLEFLKDSL